MRDLLLGCFTGIILMNFLEIITFEKIVGISARSSDQFLFYGSVLMVILISVFWKK